MWASSPGLLCRFRPRRLLHRQGSGEDQGAAARSNADLRAGLRGTCRQERAGRTPDLRDRPEGPGQERRFIAVGTPSRRGDGFADLSFVHQAAREIASVIEGYTVIVTKSTVPVGPGDEVERIIAETVPRDRFAVVSNPEFLREGAAISDFKRPDRIVIGVAEDRAPVMAELYARSISTRRRSCSPRRERRS